jgi:hypothetical protein
MHIFFYRLVWNVKFESNREGHVRRLGGKEQKNTTCLTRIIVGDNLNFNRWEIYQVGFGDAHIRSFIDTSSNGPYPRFLSIDCQTEASSIELCVMRNAEE